MNLPATIQKLKKARRDIVTLDILEVETKKSRLVLKTTAVSLAIFLLWAALADIDQVTRAPATVIASSRSQVIQAVDGGILQELLVKEGVTVEANQIIARLDKGKLEASFLEARAKAAALRMNVQRLQAELFDKPPNFGTDGKLYPQFRENQVSLLGKRRDALSQELGSLEKMLNLAREELQMTEPLLKTGDVSKSDVLRLQRQVADLNAQLINKRNKHFQDTQAELNKAQEELAGVEQILAQRKEALDSAEFKAPMKGIVKNIRITTIGGVLRPGEELLQIVPLGDDLLIEAKVRPADIGFLRSGQQANVKIDAFDFTIYGGLEGKVTYISPDTLKEETPRQGVEQEYYRVQIKVDNPEFRKSKRGKIEIQPGMTATVEIKTGQNTVLSFLTKPVTKTISESMGER